MTACSMGRRTIQLQKVGTTKWLGLRFEGVWLEAKAMTICLYPVNIFQADPTVSLIWALRAYRNLSSRKGNGANICRSREMHGISQMAQGSLAFLRANGSGRHVDRLRLFDVEN
jgi:hypothetical protein